MLKGREARTVNDRFGKPVALLKAALLWAGFVASGMAEFVTDVLSSASGFAGLSRTPEQFGALVMAGLVLGTNVAIIQDERGDMQESADMSPFVPTISKHLLVQSHAHSWLTLNGTYRHIRFNEQIEVVGKRLLCAQVSSSNATNPQFTAINLGTGKGYVRVERKERNGLLAFARTRARNEDQEQSSTAFNEWCLPLNSEFGDKTEGFFNELQWLRTGNLRHRFEGGSEGENSFSVVSEAGAYGDRSMHLEGLKGQASQHHVVYQTGAESNCEVVFNTASSLNFSTPHSGIDAVRDYVFLTELQPPWGDCGEPSSYEAECFGYELVHGGENLGEASDVVGTGIVRRELDITYIIRPGISDEIVLRAEEFNVSQTNFEKVILAPGFAEGIFITEHANGGIACQVGLWNTSRGNECIGYSLHEEGTGGISGSQAKTGDKTQCTGHLLDEEGKGEQSEIQAKTVINLFEGPNRISGGNNIQKGKLTCCTSPKDSLGQELGAINKLLRRNNAKADAAERVDETDVPEILTALLAALVGAHLSRNDHHNAFKLAYCLVAIVEIAFKIVAVAPVKTAAVLGLLPKHRKQDNREPLLLRDRTRSLVKKFERVGSIIGLGLILLTLAIPNALYVVRETTRQMWAIESYLIDGQYAGKTEVQIQNPQHNNSVLLTVPLQSVTVLSAKRTYASTNFLMALLAMCIYTVTAICYILQRICRVITSVNATSDNIS